MHTASRFLSVFSLDLSGRLEYVMGAATGGEFKIYWSEILASEVQWSVELLVEMRE